MHRVHRVISTRLQELLGNVLVRYGRIIHGKCKALNTIDCSMFVFRKKNVVTFTIHRRNRRADVEMVLLRSIFPGSSPIFSTPS